MSPRERTVLRFHSRHAFVVAWAFFVVVAGIGVLLRWATLHPLPGFNYAHVLHAHSHLGFLGWVFNAFFALALRHFVVEDDARWFWRLFWMLQVANVGMLASFPVQGYGPVSIAFSTVHMIGGAAFAWRIWRRNRASRLAGGFLRVGLVFMLISGLGPLTLGPLAVMDLRESPWYSMAIYFYLHFQYNGWFIFFLLAAWIHWSGVGGDVRRMRLAWWGLVSGVVGSFALSALWLDPPGWVFAVALAGGVAQAGGFVLWLREMGGAASRFRDGFGRALARVALCTLGLKMGLQVAGAVPALAGLVNHRFVVIGFLHLVFLGVVTPLLIAWAREAAWLQPGGRTLGGVCALLAGAGWTLGVLFGVPAGLWPGAGSGRALLAAAVLMLAGVVLAAPRYGGREELARPGGTDVDRGS